MIPLPRLCPPEGRRPGGISVTLPSRRRPEMLTASIASLRDTADRPDLLEILVAYDPDDPATAEAAQALGADLIWQAPERYGYAGQAQYIAALLAEATGEWCLPTWGDDGLMQTLHWDDIVRAQPSGTVLWVAGNVANLTCFPIVHMDVLTALGRLCPLPALDTWYEDAARDAGILIRPDPLIYVLQDRFDLTGRNNDETYREGRPGYRVTEFYHDPYLAWRAEDTAVMREHSLRNWRLLCGTC